MSTGIKKREKLQKSYSFPKAWSDWISQVFEEHKEELALFDITSPTGLMKAATKQGLPRLLKLLSEATQEDNALSGMLRGEQKPDDTSHKHPVPNHPPK